MAFKLSNPPRTPGGAVNAPHLVALVRDGAMFTNGHLTNGPAKSYQQAAA